MRLPDLGNRVEPFCSFVFRAKMGASLSVAPADHQIMQLRNGKIANAMSLTRDYFREEYCRFRKIMGDRRNAIETIQSALGGLFFVFLNVKPSECDDDIRITMAATIEEWARRSALMMMHGHPIEPTSDRIYFGDH